MNILKRESNDEKIKMYYDITKTKVLEAITENIMNLAMKSLFRK